MLVLTNGKIWTGDSFARSVEIDGNRIASLDGTAPPDARLIDLRGRLVVPGFVDNHLHFVTGSLQHVGRASARPASARPDGRRAEARPTLQLRDAASLDAFARRIAEHARTIRDGQWITGGGWDEQRWDPPQLPTRASIDGVANPVFVSRLDIHMGLANGVALQLAGITRETPDPPGGTIVRDAAGEPTGILKDAAMQLVTAHIPPPGIDERVSAVRVGLREAARCGVTSFCDMGMSAEAFDDFRAYERLDREGELTARVWMYLPIAFWERAGKRSFSERLHIAGLKGFADGSLGSSTAAFHEPLEGEPDNRGLLMQPMLDGSMARWIAAADDRDLQLAIHAIGDRANAEVLALLESRPERRARRFRIEHAQHLDPELIGRFASAGVIASAQPYHAVDDGRWAEAKIGSRRASWAFPFRSLLDAGVLVTFGSDWPVAPLDPIAGIHAAVTRRTLDGRNPGGRIPEQKITVAEALRCYTANNAWAVFGEREIGTIAPGMRADLVVLSDDLFTIAPEEIAHVRVEMTIFDGRVIYEG